jgi:hypothetical protein
MRVPFVEFRAARMESNGEAGRIHLAPTTANLLTNVGGFVIETRGDVTIKGKGLMRTSWLVGRSNPGENGGEATPSAGTTTVAESILTSTASNSHHITPTTSPRSEHTHNSETAAMPESAAEGARVHTEDSVRSHHDRSAGATRQLPLDLRLFR